jgi:hypothetical protein
MLAGSRTALTLLVLVLLVIGGGALGWSAFTEPLPQREKAPVCTDVTVMPGDHLYPGQVTVSVLNASKREGLAGRTLAALADAGFSRGGTDNAPKGTKVSTSQIWAQDADSPAVALLQTYLPDAEVVVKDSDEPGITVVVGEDFGDLADGVPSVAVTTPATVCSPQLA